MSHDTPTVSGVAASFSGRGGSFSGWHTTLASSFCCRLFHEHLTTISNVGLQINDTPWVGRIFLSLWILSICFQRHFFLFFDSPVELYPPKRASESIYNGFVMASDSLYFQAACWSALV